MKTETRNKRFKRHREQGCSVCLGTSDPTGFTPLCGDQLFCNSLNRDFELALEKVPSTLSAPLIFHGGGGGGG